MKAIELLASSINVRDDKPNQVLAIEIIRSKRYDWVRELIYNLQHTDKKIQNDCIKVLYEIGERGSADMISPYYKDFAMLLNSKNNRMIWGAMIALDKITLLNTQAVFELLPAIISTIEKGSVITIDHGISILAKLSSFPAYSSVAFPLLISQLQKCPARQLPMYAENSVVAITSQTSQVFTVLLESRISEIKQESQKKRISMILSKVSKLGRSGEPTSKKSD